MKRKFKIIFAIVAVMAMLFAFAISSSASTYDSLGSLESGHLSSSVNDGYYFYRIVAGNGFYNVAYFASYESSFYDAFGHYDLSIEEVNAFLDEENEFYNEGFWYADFVIDYPVFFELMDNDHDLGLFGEVEEVKSAYKVYSALKLGYTQSELDSALADATKDMYTQEQLEASVSQALATVPSEEDLEAKYNEGKLDGVTEYKESEEYASVLLTKYNDGFVAGTAEGALAYAKSEAYKTALAEEYDKGYDDGFVDGEAQIDVAPIIGFVVVLGLAIGALVVVKVIQKRKLR